MVKPNKLPGCTSFFTTADSAYTGWLASHPRSLLTGTARNVDETKFAARSILAGGDEPGDRPHCCSIPRDAHG